jgi:hypothetical protein
MRERERERRERENPCERRLGMAKPTVYERGSSRSVYRASKHTQRKQAGFAGHTKRREW